jgi:hypothetical protein
MLYFSDYDYDYEEPKKDAKEGKCGKGNRCGKAEKDPKDGKKEKGTGPSFDLYHVPKSIKLPHI